MSQVVLTPTLVRKLRLTAKAIHKNLPHVSHHRALDILAKEHGYQRWRDIGANAEVDEPNPVRVLHPLCLSKENIPKSRRRVIDLWTKRMECAFRPSRPPIPVMTVTRGA
ncbi:MAG: hypothetical protein HY308_09370 [Gammaproteobacteria bacterium]|nr:hypothetical protein [Gammaproteobacteria bacterium]